MERTWTTLRLIPLWTILLTTIAGCGCDRPSQSGTEVVATVNGQSIAAAEFEKALERELSLTGKEVSLKAEEVENLKEALLENLIRERIIVQRARDLALTIDDAELSARVEEIRKDYNGQFETHFSEGGIRLPEWKEALRKRMLLEKLIAREVNAGIRVTDEEAQRYYHDHRQIYATERRVRVAQIVLHDRGRAEAVLKRLKAGEDFGKVAREVSIGPEAAAGGDIGFFERGVMPEAIDRIVFSLPAGKMSPVVQSPYGFHLFKVLERAAAGGRKFADVKQKVVSDLRKQKEEEAYNVWVDGLKAKAVVRIHRPLPGGKAPAADGKAPPPSAGEEKP